MKILLIENDAVNRALLSGLLASEGYELITASDGEQALDRLTTEEPDLIVTDLVMPSMSGTMFLTKLREFNRTVPVIVQTGYPAAAQELAADSKVRVLIKPYEFPVILREVQAMLGRSETPIT